MTRRTHVGFTLVELLVVIGIIALLIGILLPSLSRARASARTTLCLSDQRQIGTLMHMYANDYESFLPPQYAVAIRLMPPPLRDTFDKYADGANTIFYCPTLLPPAKLLVGVYGMDAEAEHWSAEEHWNEPAAGFGVAHVLGYFYLGNPTMPGYDPDYFWLDVDDDGTSRDEYVVKLSDKDSANVAILTDVMPQVPAGQTHLWYLRHPADTQEDGGNNVLYGDGHANTVRRKEIVPRWYAPYPVGW